MGEQIRGEDWLPEGWKVEIRVRKTGKKDRYYTDPVHGYIFRSLKDIDRYVLTGKLGRHVTKNKPKDFDSDDNDMKLDVDPPPEKQDIPKEKKSAKSNGMKKSCPATRGQKSAENASKPQDTKAQKSVRNGSKPQDFKAQKSAGNASKPQDTKAQKSAGKASKAQDSKAHDSKQMPKEKISKPSKGRTSKPSKKRESTPFFILDSDKYDEENAIDIPNLTEIIDSMQKEREGHNAVYVSAPAIGALLGEKLSETQAKQDNNKKPKFPFSFCTEFRKPNLPGMASLSHLQKDIWKPINIVSPQKNLFTPEKHNTVVDVASNVIKESEKPLFGDLINDPCIDFAIKTLTGAFPLGSEPAEEESFLQQQLGSSMIYRGEGP